MNASNDSTKNKRKQVPTVPENDYKQNESSIKSRWKLFRSCFSSNHEVLRICPNCGVHLVETAMIQHLNQCQSFSQPFRAHDGTVTSMNYVGTNQTHEKTLRTFPNDSISHSIDGSGLQPTNTASCSKRADYTHPVIIPPTPSVPPVNRTGLKLQQNSPENFRTERPGFCRFCGDLNKNKNMIQHAEQCQTVNCTVEAPNGAKGTIYYAGTDENLRQRLSSAASCNHGNHMDCN